MADEIKRDRMLWRDGVVTVLERGKVRSTIRDRFGYVYEGISNRELQKLRSDDPEGAYSYEEAT